MGAPSRIRAVAGAGTGSTPWAQRTWPLPTWMGDTTTRSGAISCISRHTPTTSATASSAPTSWKWTWSTGSPCTAASASAMRRYTARASAFTGSGRGRESMIPAMSASAVWW